MRTCLRRWLQRNVHAHRLPGYRAVTLSFKRRGQAPGDATADQMDAAAALADRSATASCASRTTRTCCCPGCASRPAAVWRGAQGGRLRHANIGLITDMIACPGGDFCALANARSIPIAAEITERFQDLDEPRTIGDIDLHISGCINSCGHHHSGHIGILGVDKDGRSGTRSRWRRRRLDAVRPGRAPARWSARRFAADEVPTWSRP